MNITQRGLLAAHLQILAQEYFDNSNDCVFNVKLGLCYFLAEKFPYIAELGNEYDLIEEIMDGLKFEVSYFGGSYALEPFEQRAYMALILAEYLKELT